MFGLKKILFRERLLEHLPEDVIAAVQGWQQLPAMDGSEMHFHAHYVVVDIVTTGNSPEDDQVLGISAVRVWRKAIRTEESCYVDLAVIGDEDGLIRQLAAFLLFVGKAPLVTYHAPFVGGFLQKLFKEQLGLSFPQGWIDLAWLLPSMFEERSHAPVPLDFWIESFALDAGEERREAMDNTLLLAQLFLMLLARAGAKGVDTAGRLLDESRASSFLRRTH